MGMTTVLYVTLAIIIPVAMAVPACGVWMLRPGSGWARLEALAVVAIGVGALGVIAIVAAVMATAELAR